MGKEQPTINETTEAADTETTMIYLRNGDEAIGISELATLMEENSADAINMLFYQGTLKEDLEGAGETALAGAAVAAVNQFSRDHHAGIKAMAAVLRRKIKFARGGEASDPEQLADLMDKDPSQAESLLYNGVIAFWLRHTNQKITLVEAAEEVVVQFSEDRYTGVKAMVAVLRRKIKFALGDEASDPEQLAYLMDQDPNQAKKQLYNGVIAFWLRYTNQETALVEAAAEIQRYNEDNQDRGLEELIQRLDPQIEKPKPEVSPSEIDFGNMNPKRPKTLSLKIKNIGRGFLHGNVRLENDMPGLQISNTEIQRSGTVTVILDAQELKVEQKHQASLVIDTNGETVEVPISCYVTYPIQQSIRQYTVNGILMAAVALVIRLITQQFGISEWLATHIALDRLFYLGFELPAVTVWALWGFVGGTAIQGYREMQIPGRKVVGFLFALAPLLLFGIAGVIKNIGVPESSSVKVITAAEQNTSGLETKAIEHIEPGVIPTKQPATESAQKSTTPRPNPKPKTKTPAAISKTNPTKQATTEPAQKSTTQREPIPATKQSDTTSPPTQSKEATLVIQKQKTETIPMPEPKTKTLLVPSGMVLIPAGEFQMGSNDNTDEKPVHTVYVDAFYMDTYEVTNAEYKTFVDANPQWRKDQIPSKFHNGNYLKDWSGDDYPRGKGDHPVTHVSWYGAMAYANSIGKRLPTEAEWEKAARGGKSSMRYPWGNTISSGNANYGDHVEGTTAVGNYLPNEYGLHDMAGNVSEWCLDVYYSNFYRSSPHRNPLAGMDTVENVDLVISNFANDTAARVVRGGSWIHDEEHLRIAYRNEVSPTLTNKVLGFRCVVTPLDRK